MTSNTKRKNEVPLHTRIGIKVTVIVLLVLTAIILRNCMGAIRYGTSTNNELVRHYYELGQENGARQAAAGAAVDIKEPPLDNPLLRKAYRQGFHKGWDSERRSGGEETAGAKR